MTVRELMDELSKHDLDAEVFAHDNHFEGVNAIDGVDIDTIEYYVLTKKKGKPPAVIIY